MPPFKCHVEIRPQEQFPDPTSITLTRRMRDFDRQKTEAFSDLKYSRVITFVMEASDLEAAKITVDALCDEFLVNRVYEQAVATVTDPSNSQ